MNNNESRNTETPPKWRAWLHIGMGLVYFLFAALVFKVKKFGSIELDETYAYMMSGLLTAYGIFRIWRGSTDLRNINRLQ